jgi:enhancing lycopene biosynthesis protein 2
MTKVALVLSGCGFKDGSEIHETVLAMLGLEQAGATISCFAPAGNQPAVINHLTGEKTDESRSMLAEAARIARGRIRDLKEASPADFDAVVLPGGFGAACNLSDFATAGAGATVNPDLEKFLIGMHEAGKPIGAICIAPAVVARVFGKQQATLTIGHDKDTAGAIAAMGAKHVDAPVDGIVIDSRNRIVSTPAYMLGEKVSDIAPGIFKLTAEVVKMANA